MAKTEKGSGAPLQRAAPETFDQAWGSVWLDQGSQSMAGICLLRA